MLDSTEKEILKDVKKKYGRSASDMARKLAGMEAAVGRIRSAYYDIPTQPRESKKIERGLDILGEAIEEMKDKRATVFIKDRIKV